MSALRAASLGRLFAQGQFRSSCTIRAASGAAVMDPETGEVVATPGGVVYSGPCRVRPASGPGGDSAVRDAGGGEVFTFDFLVSVPFSVTAAQVRQRVRIDASPDPALIGLDLEVQHVDRGENVTARRLQCNEVV